MPDKCFSIISQLSLRVLPTCFNIFYFFLSSFCKEVKNYLLYYLTSYECTAAVAKSHHDIYIFTLHHHHHQHFSHIASLHHFLCVLMYMHNNFPLLRCDGWRWKEMKKNKKRRKSFYPLEATFSQWWERSSLSVTRWLSSLSTKCNSCYCYKHISTFFPLSFVHLLCTLQCVYTVNYVGISLSQKCSLFVK